MTDAWSATAHYHSGDEVQGADGRTYRAQAPVVGSEPPDWPWEPIGVPLARMVRRVDSNVFGLANNAMVQVAWDQQVDLQGDITYNPVTKRFTVNTDGVYALTAVVSATGDGGDAQRVYITAAVVQPEGGALVYAPPELNQAMAPAGIRAAGPLVLVDWLAAGTELIIDVLVVGTAATYSLNGSTARLVRLT